MDTTTRRDGRSSANLLAQRLLEARWPESTGTLAGADPIVTRAAALALAWHLLATEPMVSGPNATDSHAAETPYVDGVLGSPELDVLRDRAAAYASDSDTERQAHSDAEYVRSLLLSQSEARIILMAARVLPKSTADKLRRIAGGS
jgi:hypothetical protein